MPSFALHMEGITVAEAADLNGKVTEMKRAGREVAALCVGEPNFDTADAVKAAAVRAIDAGKTKYSPLAGIPELQAAICRKFKQDNGLDYRAENIIVSSGGKQVINSALAATLNPGDEVVIAQPFWLGYPDMVRMYRGHPVFVETTVFDSLAYSEGDHSEDTMPPCLDILRFTSDYLFCPLATSSRICSMSNTKTVDI